MTIVAAVGVDAGSTTCKLAAVDAAGTLLGSRLEVAEPRVEEQVHRLLEELLSSLGAADSKVPVMATGYGRRLVQSAYRSTTEITCHAHGVFAELGHDGTLVDVGGQDSKVILVGPGGRVKDFAMNDKCAAGTGRFLEQTAARLEVTVEELGTRALSTSDEKAITSTCTVFAESEVISLLAHGERVEAILRGLHRSLANRIGAMVKTVGLAPPLMVSGGVARNAAFRTLLGENLNEEPMLPPHPQLSGALGAALLALEA